jgi:hypothetical protein
MCREVKNPVNIKGSADVLFFLDQIRDRELVLHDLNCCGIKGQTRSNLKKL